MPPHGGRRLTKPRTEAGPHIGWPHCAVGMQSALDSAIGLPSRSTSAAWMLGFVTPAGREQQLHACLMCVAVMTLSLTVQRSGDGEADWTPERNSSPSPPLKPCRHIDMSARPRVRDRDPSARLVTAAMPRRPTVLEPPLLRDCRATVRGANRQPRGAVWQLALRYAAMGFHDEPGAAFRVLRRHPRRRIGGGAGSDCGTC